MEDRNEEFGEEHQEPQPWYRNRDINHPFRLFKKIVVEGPNTETLRTIAFFPWNDSSLHELWDGALATEENNIKWKGVLENFRDAIAIAGDTQVYICWLMRRKHPLLISIPDIPGIKLIHSDTTNVAWTLSPNAIGEPLLIFSKGSLLWIYNPVSKGLSSYLRGHGGAITSLAVHPLRPNLFCSTSRDHTTRIYDLTLTPHQGQKDPNVNPHWPPGTLPSRAGAPHGLHMNEPEGLGAGRCVVVLMGGRSGGHQAAVLNASFHPHYPVIATCGIDRCIKIWHIYPQNSVQITREDKPLFSSSRIHRSRVLSVRWLAQDVLISHCPSGILRDDPNDIENKNVHLVPGEIVVWRWLGLDRFFPPQYDRMRADGQTQGVLRGCASDYQESASFTMISTSAFSHCRSQLISPVVNLYQSPIHDPLALCVTPPGIPSLRSRDDRKSKAGDPNKNVPREEQPSQGDNDQQAINGGKEKKRKNKSQRKETSSSTTPPVDNSSISSQARVPEGQTRNTDKSLSGSASLLPPDEPPVWTKTEKQGNVKKYAGAVKLVHVPSLPVRAAPRFPLARKAPILAESSGTPSIAIRADSSAVAPTTGDTVGGNGDASVEMGTETPLPVLSGISEWHPGLVETEPPPPIPGWLLDVPLDERDLVFESLPTAAPRDFLNGEDDGMNVDSSTTTEALDTSQNKDKRSNLDEVLNSEKAEEEQIKVRVQTAAMGMNGRVIVVLGTRGRMWVFRMGRWS